MVNEETINLITKFEGFVDHWYPDPALGWKVPTVAYGHTDAAGEPKYLESKDEKFSKADGITILQSDLKKYEDSVDSLVTVPVTSNQRGALVSFTYNLGAGNLKKSTLLKKVNSGDFEGASNEFGKWVNAGGKRLEGLVKRRAAEKELFLKTTTETVKKETKMNPIIGAIVGSLLRHVVTAAATVLGSTGLFTGDETSTVAGAIGIVLSVGWSLVDGWLKTKKK